jgi:hypothetical protein
VTMCHIFYELSRFYTKVENPWNQKVLFLKKQPLSRGPNATTPAGRPPLSFSLRRKSSI